MDFKYNLIEDSNGKTTVFNSVTDIVHFFKDSYKFKIPDYIKESLNKNASVRFNVCGAAYLIERKIKYNK